MHYKTRDDFECFVLSPIATVRNPQNAIALSADSLLMEAKEQPETFRPEHIRIFETIQSSSEFVTALLEGSFIFITFYYLSYIPLTLLYG